MIALSATPVLQTERLVLRAPAARDWEAFNAFLASDRGAFVRSGGYAEDQTWRAFGHAIGHWVLRGFGMFVFTDRDDGRALGMCGPWRPVGWPENEIGWQVWAPEAEGKGYAFEAARAALAHAFGALGWDTAVSYVAPSNARSARLAERLGACPDGSAAYPGTAPLTVYRYPRPEARA